MKSTLKKSQKKQSKVKNLKNVKKSPKRIYLPVSCRVVTPGHIKVIDSLIKKGRLTIGLLTHRAMSGYKDEVVPYKDRLFILKRVAPPSVIIVAQESLNPYKNLKKFKCTHIASGDGFEESEIKAAKSLNVTLLKVGTTKRYSSSKILEYYNTKTRY